MRSIHVLLLVIFGLLVSPVPVRADIAPPAEPPGANLQPGSASTQVRMQAETVLIDVQPTAPSGSLGRAAVTADFVMRNVGDQPETMAARFPIGASDGRSAVPEIRDLRIQVDGKNVRTRRISGEDPYGGSSEVPWAEFDITFPIASDVNVRVEYTLEAAGDAPFVWFKYILSTGAGWKDTIGSADLIVRLPYPASNQNVLFNFEGGYIDTTPGGAIDGREIRWHFADLEPTSNDNFQVDLVMPSQWEQVLLEQSNVQQNPKDGEAWGRLGKLYKETCFSARGKGFRLYESSPDPGAQDLYQLSLQAYEKAVSLKPDDPLWHAGFADLLAYHAYFQAFQGVDPGVEASHAMREIQRALELAPTDPKVLEIASLISYDFPKGMVSAGNSYDYPWLTATPLPPTPRIPSSTQTATAVSLSDTPTAIPVISPSPPESPRPPSLPICGGALVLALALFWVHVFRS